MQHRPDVVFVDLHMTVIDGESTVRILRAANAYVPIVLVTGDTKALMAWRWQRDRLLQETHARSELLICEALPLERICPASKTNK